MIRLLNVLIIVIVAISCSQSQQQHDRVVLSRETLRDKIMGGWAGQTIGVTFGGPYEFRFQGAFIADYQPLRWYEGYLKETMMNNPGLYDDLYMDLTFVDVFEKYGLDAPVDSFANAYARAGYMLWHANQAGRYNILHGIAAPESGHWKNNPHADCIDYQIEADFAGLMSPGMPNTASAISDKIGHIMNYGDGWYGGVYVGAMYALAFTSSDVPFIVSEALKTIPEQSDFYHCIQDVIDWHKKYPTDWKQTWLEVEKKWAGDVGCPDGVFSAFNIDAKVNAAYVVMGLLYGEGDFTKTLEIATRTGQDADCNPSSAGGILGTVLGYKNIPAYWKLGLSDAEGIDFKYTSVSLSDVYEIGLKHALQNIERGGGSIEGDTITIKIQTPVAVKFEKSFDGHYPQVKIPVTWSEGKDEINFEFEGTGFVLRGDASSWNNQSEYVFETELYLDDQLIDKPQLPVSFTTRRHELCWKYELPKGKHAVKMKILNPTTAHPIQAWDAIIYADQPVNGIQLHIDAAKK
ncbi:MAG: ADP-ribosylglycohydrolase family protein [Cyclobacteriaceae bacterium]|nr:ADP-ribosylglycohydrolase family protein [Cyclobacteriaceae bacterium]